jgi:hypothetical protein
MRMARKCDGDTGQPECQEYGRSAAVTVVTLDEKAGSAASVGDGERLTTRGLGVGIGDGVADGVGEAVGDGVVVSAAGCDVDEHAAARVMPARASHRERIKEHTTHPS